MDADAADRRARTLETFAAAGFTVGDPYWHRDLLPGETNASLPGAEDIVMRALALMMVAGEAGGLGDELVDRLIDLYRPPFSPAEWRWFESPARDADLTAWFSLSFESAVPLLWATGFAGDLPRPDRRADAYEVMKLVLDHGREQLVGKAAVRPLAEILDVADLHHGYLRACRWASVDGIGPPTGLDPYVVLMRNRAFRWLIGSPSHDWDEVVEAA